MNKFRQAYDVIGSILPRGVAHFDGIASLPEHFETFKELVNDRIKQDARLNQTIEVGQKWKNIEHCIGRYQDFDTREMIGAIDLHNFLNAYEVVRVTPQVVGLKWTVGGSNNEVVITRSEFLRCFIPDKWISVNTNPDLIK